MSFVTTAPYYLHVRGWAGDSRANVQGSDRLSSPAVPDKCRACYITQIYPSGICYYKEQGYDSQQGFDGWEVVVPAAPVGGGKGGGAVVTNDWCITITYMTVVAYVHCDGEDVSWLCVWWLLAPLDTGKLLQSDRGLQRSRDRAIFSQLTVANWAY